ncbi:hypothetical protein AB0F96_31865 [Streptomyces sp. NPDC023998]|uniref:hypothetical protein n=1 Tax=Streptomyces sp. NPDC023998 TaxID=3154597 RepID=UPI003405439F
MRSRTAVPLLTALALALAAPSAFAHAAAKPKPPKVTCTAKAKPTGSHYCHTTTGKPGKTPAKTLAIVANKKTNTLYWASGDWMPTKPGGITSMRLIIEKPNKKPAPYPDARYKAARDESEIVYLHRAKWDFNKRPLKLPNNTRVWIEIKGHGVTPSITL